MSSFLRWFLKFDSRLHAISGLGILLGLVEVALWLDILLNGWTPPRGNLVGTVTSLPFTLWLVFGSYWISQGGLPSERYHRLSRRVLGGSTGFLGINIILMVVLLPGSLMLVVGWIRWAVSLGGGVGLLVGFLEARAIHTEFEAERARLQREQLRQKNIRIQGFSHLMTNDLRDPLTQAQSRLQLAKEETETPRHEEIEEALDRIELLIDEFLTLVREGTPAKETKPVKLPEVAEGAWQPVNTPEASLCVEAEATIHANPDRFEELLENLLRNAIDHGGTDVTVSIGTFEEGFFIEDDGPGIPEDERGEIFEPGFSTAETGTGLGLAIVRQIAEAHGWDILVTESEANGARFEITGVDAIESVTGVDGIESAAHD